MPALHLFNTLTRRLEEFHPLHPPQVGLYACGPTVYFFQHIGNLRYMLWVDTLRRTLELNGYDVHHVMNITDVGHLVSDADEGEDKMLVAMRREGKSAYEIARFYEATVFQDFRDLSCLMPSETPRATEHIPEQIALVKTLEEKGFTYRTSDGIYMDTARLPEYGQLSGQASKEKRAGARVSVGEKRNPTDFALWKFAQEGVTREMIWDSPWGPGFPGWHAECSAMAKKYLGVPFDLHTGGEDHIAVHHENELAQTWGADGCLEANTWMHIAFLNVDGGKMSKSLQNTYTLADLRERGYSPRAFRYFCLQAHYRTPLNFTFEALEASVHALERLDRLLERLPKPKETPCDEKIKESFLLALNADMNTPAALAVLWNVLEDKEISLEEKASAVLCMDHVFGLNLAEHLGGSERALEVPKEVHLLVAKREEARAAKNYEESDRLRDEIALRGFVVKDTPQGPELRPKG